MSANCGSAERTESESFEARNERAKTSLDRRMEEKRREKTELIEDYIVSACAKLKRSG